MHCDNIGRTLSIYWYSYVPNWLPHLILLRINGMIDTSCLTPDSHIQVFDICVKQICMKTDTTMLHLTLSKII